MDNQVIIIYHLTTLRNDYIHAVRVYLFSLVLYKTYFEVFDGLNEQHFRYIGR